MKTTNILRIAVPAIAVPAVATVAIMQLWNALMPPLVGAAPVGAMQAFGLFVLGQLLSGGILFGLFLLVAMVHVVRHDEQLGAHRRWKGMTDEERREFIDHWRAGRFGRTRHSHPADGHDGED